METTDTVRHGRASAGHRLRELLGKPELLVLVGAYDALSARLIETAGFSSVYLSGSGVAASLLGGADVGLVSQTEMVDVARHVAGAVSIPVVSDADTGYGGVLNVRRTVRDFDQAGVAAIHLEDQTLPKRCGHFAGKELVSTEEMIGKLHAAVDARIDPDFVIIGRTDSRAVEGVSGAIERSNRYLEAGADLVFADALLSEEEMREYARSVPGLKAITLGGYARTRTTPRVPFSLLQEMGYSMVILPLALLRAAAKAALDFATETRETGIAAEEKFLASVAKHPVEDWYGFLGLGDLAKIEEKYMPRDIREKRYASGIGYKPPRGTP